MEVRARRRRSAPPSAEGTLKAPDGRSAPSCHQQRFCLCIAPVASPSSWQQQQAGWGCAGARCMLGDYTHQRLEPTQLCVLGDRRRAGVRDVQSSTRWKGPEVLTPQLDIKIDEGEDSRSSENP